MTNISFHIMSYTSALLIVVTCIVYTLIEHRTQKRQNKVYLVMLVVLALNAISCIVTSFSRSYPEIPSCHVISNIFMFVYFLFHTALCPIFYNYTLVVTGYNTKLSARTRTLFNVPFILSEIPVLLNPIFRPVFYYDEALEFHRNWGETIIYISAAFYFVASLFLLLRSWKGLTVKKRRALMYLFCITFLGLLIQLLFIDLKVELLAESIGVLGLMLSVENEDDRMDSDTELYNRKAFITDISNLLYSRQNFRLITVKITNSDIVQRSTGSSNMDSITILVSEFFKSILPKYCIYNLSYDTYILLIQEESRDYTDNIINKILNRFDEEWHVKSSDILLHTTLMLTEIPKDYDNIESILRMVDSSIPENVDKKVLEGADLDYIIRRAEVEEAIQKGLENGSFEVYYQPTYYMEDLSLYGAEALVRLHSESLGNLYPDEFIPIAENIGLIDDIDNFVLSEVCDFIKSGLPAEYGMKSINVNLSVLQCMHPDFVNETLHIVDNYNIDKSMINFEITESVAANDYTTLSGIIDSLRNNGFMFSVDDYGTGYSNIQSIFSINFDIVKIDKSILWAAERDEFGMIILSNSIRMITQLGKKILVEGVETKEQIELLKQFPVDYLQGFYFSKPIPKKDFLEFVSRQQDN